MIVQEETQRGGCRPAEPHTSFVSVKANHFAFPESQLAVYWSLTPSSAQPHDAEDI